MENNKRTTFATWLADYKQFRDEFRVFAEGDLELSLSPEIQELYEQILPLDEVYMALTLP